MPGESGTAQREQLVSGHQSANGSVFAQWPQECEGGRGTNRGSSQHHFWQLVKGLSRLEYGEFNSFTHQVHQTCPLWLTCKAYYTLMVKFSETYFLGPGKGNLDNHCQTDWTNYPTQGVREGCGHPGLPPRKVQVHGLLGQRTFVLCGSSTLGSTWPVLVNPSCLPSTSLGGQRATGSLFPSLGEFQGLLITSQSCREWAREPAEHNLSGRESSVPFLNVAI